MNEKDVRAVLGRFLFVQEDVKKLSMTYPAVKSTITISTFNVAT